MTVRYMGIFFEGESAEYIKSYFLNPHTINNLIWVVFDGKRKELENDAISKEEFEKFYLSNSFFKTSFG